MELSPYLTFNGQCAEAFSFYERCLGGKLIAMQTHGQSPMKDKVPADWRDKILHARLDLGGGNVLMGSDAPPDHYEPPRGTHVSISVTSEAEAGRIFKALEEKGTVTMPFQKTFWSPAFGMLVDRFGIPWIVNTEQAD